MDSELADQRPQRRAAEERMADIVLPNQTNGFGTMFGGDVMALMDKAAAIAALRFCRQPVVTASTERIDFRTPISQGEIVEALARVVYVGTTSMVVRIRVYAEHPLEGDRRICTTGYFSMVAVAPNGKPAPVPRLLLDDEEDHSEWQIGAEVHTTIAARRQQRTNI